MRQAADADGRLAPRARRGLANLARLAGDFPTALPPSPTLGWKGRHHRVLGDIHWSQADTTAAIAAFEAGRAEAEQHGAAGERAMTQVRLNLAVSFADPVRAADELALAGPLPNGLDQRSNRSSPRRSHTRYDPDQICLIGAVLLRARTEHRARGEQPASDRRKPLRRRSPIFRLCPRVRTACVL
ncbi:putative ATP/GTP-binding protein [Streptomyces sp. L-9-10]|uniref:hypothetical protein n=1 Tax=Streptomyces sp. L-9-10 TaxID=1478131 RepID=UPI0010DE9023|nr:hypothetical protein [Streptomyces sp. L-9-10]RYJ20639.1 putative ATP/GTP-binding protein [Streptomyces sp. L-9-10]